MVISDLTQLDKNTIIDIVRRGDLGKVLYDYREKIDRKEALSRIEVLLSVLFTREYLDDAAPMARGSYEKMKFYDEVRLFLNSLRLTEQSARAALSAYEQQVASYNKNAKEREYKETTAALQANAYQSVKCEVNTTIGVTIIYTLLDVYLDKNACILGVGKPFNINFKPQLFTVNIHSAISSISSLFERHKGKPLVYVVGKNGITLKGQIQP